MKTVMRHKCRKRSNTFRNKACLYKAKVKRQLADTCRKSLLKSAVRRILNNLKGFF